MWGGGGIGVRGWSLFTTGDVGGGGGVTGVRGWSLFTTGDVFWWGGGGGGTGVSGWSLLQGMFSTGYTMEGPVECHMSYDVSFLSHS